MEIGADHQRDRTIARGVQAANQDADPAAVGGNRSDAVLGGGEQRFRQANGLVESSPEGLLASGQIIMRKVDGWQTLAEKVADQPLDLAA